MKLVSVNYEEILEYFVNHVQMRGSNKEVDEVQAAIACQIMKIAGFDPEDPSSEKRFLDSIRLNPLEVYESIRQAYKSRFFRQVLSSKDNYARERAESLAQHDTETFGRTIVLAFPMMHPGKDDAIGVYYRKHYHVPMNIISGIRKMRERIAKLVLRNTPYMGDFNEAYPEAAEQSDLERNVLLLDIKNKDNWSKFNERIRGYIARSNMAGNVMGFFPECRYSYAGLLSCLSDRIAMDPILQRYRLFFMEKDYDFRRRNVKIPSEKAL